MIMMQFITDLNSGILNGCADGFHRVQCKKNLFMATDFIVVSFKRLFCIWRQPFHKKKSNQGRRDECRQYDTIFLCCYCRQIQFKLNNNESFRSIYTIALIDNVAQINKQTRIAFIVRIFHN